MTALRNAHRHTLCRLIGAREADVGAPPPKINRGQTFGKQDRRASPPWCECAGAFE